MDNILCYEKVFSDAFPLKKSYPLSAGFDISAYYDTTVLPNSKVKIKTGLKVFPPDGSYIRIAPRSGMAWNNFISIGGGVS